MHSSGTCVVTVVVVVVVVVAIVVVRWRSSRLDWRCRQQARRPRGDRAKSASARRRATAPSRYASSDANSSDASSRPSSSSPFSKFRVSVVALDNPRSDGGGSSPATGSATPSYCASGKLAPPTRGRDPYEPRHHRAHHSRAALLPSTTALRFLSVSPSKVTPPFVFTLTGATAASRQRLDAIASGLRADNPSSPHSCGNSGGSGFVELSSSTKPSAAKK